MMRCGYYQVVDGGGNVVEHRYLTDFGDVRLPAAPERDDSALLTKMQSFARAKWEAGEDAPFVWKGDA